MAEGEFLKRDALIRYHFHEDPDVLDDEKYFLRWEQLKYCLKKDGKWEG